MSDSRADLAQSTLGVLSIGGLIVATVWILYPFLGATIWAAMVVVATWPLLLKAQARLWNRRSLAVLTMVLVLLLLFVLPLTLAIATIVANAQEVLERLRALISEGPPRLPDWISHLPLVGPRITVAWNDLVAAGLTGLQERFAPYAKPVTAWLLAQAGVVGALTLQFLLTVVIAGVMYAYGERAAAHVLRFGRRLGGRRGEEAVALAGQAVRAVALGVGVTATVQAVVAGIGLAIAAVPFAGLLTAVMFVLCIIQVGPMLVLVPAVVWVFWSGAQGWGVFLLVWTLIVGTMDNFLRPILIRRGADLPLLLIFAGVIGGLLAFGLIGIFVGPVMLAVSYTLFNAWLQDFDPHAVDAKP